jgi:hypothetical protein
VTLDDCKNKRNQTIEKLIRNDIEPFYRNLFISELIGPLSETDYEIPIVDSKNRLRGTISNEAILNAIS